MLTLLAGAFTPAPLYALQSANPDSLYISTPTTTSISPMLQPTEGQALSEVSVLPGLAEGHLKNLASRRARQRKIMGGLNLGVGVGLSIIGGSMLSKADGNDSFSDGLNTYFGQYYLLTGVSSAVIGTVTLAVPSKQERSYREVLDYEDPLVREQQAEKELYRLARKARVNRIIGSVFTGTILTALVFSDDSSSDLDVWIPFMAGSLIFNIARKSLEERTLQAYQEEKAAYAGPKLSMELGAGPTAGGGGVMQLRLRF